jgi:hypothetical protein
LKEISRNHKPNYWGLSINVREYRRENQNGQSRERQTELIYNTIFVGHHYTQTNTDNVNKTRAPIQTTEGIIIIM